MRRYVAAAVLAVLLVVDAALIGLAWRHIRSSDVQQAGGKVPVATGSSSASGSAGKAGSAASSAAVQGKVIVSAISDTRAWRAVTATGACKSGAAKAEVASTNDGGTTWTPVEVPLVTVSALSLSGVSMIATGLDGSCKPAAYTFSASAAPTVTTSSPAWGVSATDAATLNVAGKATAARPCPTGIVDVAADSSFTATVLCSDGAIVTSTDSGARWVKSGSAPGSLGIATDSQSRAIYAVTPAGCGLAVTRVGATSTGSACVPGTTGAQGPADLSITGSTQWLATTSKAWTQQLSSTSVAAPTS